MKLNGWQRIWIVCGVIIFAIVCFFTVLTFPKKSDITSRWVYETISVVKKPHEYSYEIREAYKDYDDIQLIEKIHKKKYESEHDGFYYTIYKARFEEIDSRYNAELKGLPVSQIKHILTALAVYLCIMLAIYGLGWSIGWIYRGFKRT